MIGGYRAYYPIVSETVTSCAKVCGFNGNSFSDWSYVRKSFISVSCPPFIGAHMCFQTEYSKTYVQTNQCSNKSTKKQQNSKTTTTPSNKPNIPCISHFKISQSFLFDGVLQVDKFATKSSIHPPRNAPCMEYLPAFTKKFKPNVGKYTKPMEHILAFCSLPSNFSPQPKKNITRTGFIVLPTQTMHCCHTLALFDPPKVGNLMTTAGPLRDKYWLFN